METGGHTAYEDPRNDRHLALLHVATAEAQCEHERAVGGGDLMPELLAESVGMSAAHSHSREQQNQPRYRGVSYEKRKGVWRARLYCKGQHTTLGRFPSAELAARSHDQAAVFVIGDRAATNFGTAYDPSELERFFNSDAGRKRRPFRKLVELRDAVQKDRQGSHLLPDERQARALRQVAAAAAFSGSGSGEIWTHLPLLRGQGGLAINASEGGGGGGGANPGGRSSSPPALCDDDGSKNPLVAADAWMALVLAAARSAHNMPAGR